MKDFVEIKLLLLADMLAVQVFISVLLLAALCFGQSGMSNISKLSSLFPCIKMFKKLQFVSYIIFLAVLQ